MWWRAVALVSLGATAFSAGASAPKIECELQMRAWCILRIPSDVRMETNGRYREWHVNIGADVTPATVDITEDKYCYGEISYVYLDPRGGKVSLLTKDQCGLSVSINKKDKNVSDKAVVNSLIKIRSADAWRSAIQ